MEIDENSNYMEFTLKLEHLNSNPMISLNLFSINQLGKESNSLEIGSQAGRVNTDRAMDKKNISKISSSKFKVP